MGILNSISSFFRGKLSSEVFQVWGQTVRSPGWGKVRDDFLLCHSICCGCGSMSKLEVHHIQPFHVRPDLELDKTNLITLCRECHYQIGHLRDWRLCNATVIEDANEYKRKYLSARENRV